MDNKTLSDVLLCISLLLLWWYQGHHKRHARVLQTQIDVLRDRAEYLEFELLKVKTRVGL